MQSTIDFQDALQASYEAIQLATGNELMKEFRAKAFENFQAQGVPTRKYEEYKFTPIDRFLKGKIDFLRINETTPITQKEVEEHFYEIEGSHLVFVNGQFHADWSRIHGDLSLHEIDENFLSGDDQVLGQIADYEHDPFAALNHACFTSGISIKVASKEKTSVFIYHVIDSRQGQVISQPKVCLEAFANTQVAIAERLVLIGDNTLFHNPLTEVLVHENAQVNLTKVQAYGESHFVIDGVNVNQKRYSNFTANTMSFSGKLVRNNLNIAQLDENCESHMNGLYLLGGTSHVDNHTAVDHKMPNAYSNEMYKGIVTEKSTGVFNGKIYVRPGAQQTNAFQSNNNISLSDNATIHTKPQLEIWADDVKCSHGCTIGQLDEDALFYLRARGLDELTAKAIMLNAFAQDALTGIPFEVISKEVTEEIANRLAQ
ncbi:MAG: Fe-S cluster assembly protein SufD [Bacteroidota bacterium]